MHARRPQVSKPAWSGDELDSETPPEIEAPYFDEDLGAWVLSRHADILAAFRSLELAPASANSASSDEPPDDRPRMKMREQTLEALQPAHLRAWRERLAPRAAELAGGLSPEQAMDLMAGYARPLCLFLAEMVTGLEPGDAEPLEKHARELRAAAAEPYDPILRARADAARDELDGSFRHPCAAMREPAFVALSQTMPCILGNAWFALLRRPVVWLRLHRQPELVEQAVEELLRYAGLARILFRTALEDVSINGSTVRKGERVILRIIAANRDPARFPDPNEVDLTRRGGGHLTLGAGPHSCTGANLIRMAAAAITGPLAARFRGAELTGPVDWQGGSGFRWPGSLPVRFTDGPAEAPR